MNKQYFREYIKIADLIGNYINQRIDSESTSKQKKDFIKSVHRCWNSAQYHSINLIEKIRDDESIDNDEKFRFELIIRRLIDTIAWSVWGEKQHILRRLILNTNIKPIDIRVLKNALHISQEMHTKNRLSFALLNDLTTFIQVGDLSYKDFKSKVMPSLVELKEGKVNEIISSIIDDYEPIEPNLEKIKNNPKLEKRFIRQALRNFKQKIRMADVQEILDSNRGKDLHTKQSIMILDGNDDEKTYKIDFNKMISTAEETGYATLNLQNVLFLSAFKAASKIDTVNGCLEVLKTSVVTSRFQQDDLELRDYIEKYRMIDGNNELTPFNLFESNLLAQSSIPYPMWGIKREIYLKLFNRKLMLFGLFDPIRFIHLANNMGYDFRFSTRKSAEGHKKSIGKKHIPTWNYRAIEYIKNDNLYLTMSGGLLDKMIFSFLLPSSLIKSVSSLDSIDNN